MFNKLRIYFLISNMSLPSPFSPDYRKKRLKAGKTWETTQEPNLLRNTASGRYYDRFTVASKQKWIHLDTDVWAVAKLRLPDERSKVERLRQATENIGVGGAGMGDLVALCKQRIEDRVNIKPKTKRRLHEEVETIVKTWLNFPPSPPAGEPQERQVNGSGSGLDGAEGRGDVGVGQQGTVRLQPVLRGDENPLR